MDLKNDILKIFINFALKIYELVINSLFDMLKKMSNHQNQQKSQMGFVKKSYGADVRFSVIYTYRNRNNA